MKKHGNTKEGSPPIYTTPELYAMGDVLPFEELALWGSRRS